LISNNAPCFRHECHLPCGIGLGRNRFGLPQNKKPHLSI
jgi:hypothetical protein